MPIRTNRGRAAALRKLWGWPLRSSRHLGASIVVLILLGVGITTAAAQFGGNAAPAAQEATETTTSVPSSATTSSTSAASTPNSTGSTTAAPTTSAPATDPVAEANTVVRSFMSAWTQASGKTSETWVDSLAPHTVPEYLVQLRTVDPSRLGAISLTSPATPASTSASVIEWDQPTSIGTVKVTTVLYQGKWLVKRYDLAGAR